jgi:hypothetical protein
VFLQSLLPRFVGAFFDSCVCALDCFEEEMGSPLEWIEGSFEATWRQMQAAVLDFMNQPSPLTICSEETQRFDKSMSSF